MTSIDKPISQDGDSSLGDFLSDDTVDVPHEALVSIVREKLEAAKAVLPPIERKVIDALYPSNNTKPPSHTDLAKALGYKSAKMVREVERRALDRLEAREPELRTVFSD